MKSRKIILLSAIIVIGLFAVAQAELKPAAFGQPNEPAVEANAVKLPFVGEILGDAVNLRSGPGMNFYSCGKISSPARVVVVGQKYSWAQILPPPGSFSWIFKQYVETDPNNPGVGVVNGDNVRVYAGSDELEPMRSDSVQINMSTGQKVRIIGEAVGDYYKIAAPEGSTLWTTSQYVKFIRSADEIDVKIPQTAADANTSGKPELIKEQIKETSRELEQYYTLEKQFETEKTKPLDTQDFSKIKAELTALMNDPNSGKAGQYAKYLIRNVERCELAKESKTIVEGQKTELDQKLTEIEKANQDKKKTLADTSKYAIVGTFRQSLVYQDQPGGQRYLIIDDNNKPICYAEAVGEIAEANLTDYYEQKVGLIGHISADKQSSIALVKFEKIEKIEQSAAPQADPNATIAIPGEPNAVGGEPNDPNGEAEKK
ncbi:MAG: SH3 domain-containing protein [Phycisphaerae bacterium]|nr:SH3 domain-containing protein [Phycisphaerae bacterium]